VTLPVAKLLTGGIAIRVTGVLKLPYHDKVEVPREECFILYYSLNNVFHNTIYTLFFT
jgi:hypothetical protein